MLLRENELIKNYTLDGTERFFLGGTRGFTSGTGSGSSMLRGRFWELVAILDERRDSIGDTRRKDEKKERVWGDTRPIQGTRENREENAIPGVFST